MRKIKYFVILFILFTSSTAFASGGVATTTAKSTVTSPVITVSAGDVLFYTLVAHGGSDNFGNRTCSGGNWAGMYAKVKKGSNATTTESDVTTVMTSSGIECGLSTGGIIQVDADGTYTLGGQMYNGSWGGDSYMTLYWDVVSVSSGGMGPTYVSASSTATTSDILVGLYMSSGEILIAFLLFLIVLLMGLSMVFRALDRVRTQKKIMAYGGGDVEIRNDV